MLRRSEKAADLSVPGRVDMKLLRARGYGDGIELCLADVAEKKERPAKKDSSTLHGLRDAGASSQ